MESSAVAPHHSSRPSPSSKRPAAASQHQPTRMEASLAELLALTEEQACLDDQTQQLGADVESRRLRLHVAGMSLRRERERLAQLEARRNPVDGAGAAIARLAEAIAAQEAEHRGLVAELEVALRDSDRARQDLRNQRAAVAHELGASIERLSPQVSHIHRALADRGIRWPVVRVTDSACGGCASPVEPQAPGEPWLCPACGRLLSL